MQFGANPPNHTVPYCRGHNDQYISNEQKDESSNRHFSQHSNCSHKIHIIQHVKLCVLGFTLSSYAIRLLNP